MTTPEELKEFDEALKQTYVDKLQREQEWLESQPLYQTWMRIVGNKPRMPQAVSPRHYDAMAALMRQPEPYDPARVVVPIEADGVTWRVRFRLGTFAGTRAG